MTLYDNELMHQVHSNRLKTLALGIISTTYDMDWLNHYQHAPS